MWLDPKGAWLEQGRGARLLLLEQGVGPGLWFVLGGARWVWPEWTGEVRIKAGAWVESWGGGGGCGFEIGWG